MIELYMWEQLYAYVYTLYITFWGGTQERWKMDLYSKCTEQMLLCIDDVICMTSDLPPNGHMIQIWDLRSERKAGVVAMYE